MRKKFYIFEGELLPLAENPTWNFVAYSHEIVSETVRLYNTKALFLEEHVQNLQQSVESIFLPMPACATADRISRYITRLLNVNKVYKGGLATIHIIAQREQLPQLAITINPLPELAYSFNRTGLYILHSSEFVLPQPYLASTYNCNVAVYNIASRYAQFNNHNVATLCNLAKHIESTTAGELVYMKGKELTVVGNLPINPLFKHFLQFVAQNNYSLSRNPQCEAAHLENANDVFIFSIENGIRWVSRVNNSVYGFKYAKDLHQLLLRFLEEL